MNGNEAVRVVVTPRDLRFLQTLTEAKLLDREQFQVVAGIQRVNRANDRLLRLYSAGLLRRHFTGTIAGGRKALYSLSTRGAKLIGKEKVWKFQHPEDELLIGDGFAAHQAAVNRIWMEAKYQHPASAESLRWITFNEPLTEAIPLVPDGFFSFRIYGETRAHFLEVDLGTESGKVWERKVELYVKLATSSDVLAQLFGLSRFRVLVTAPTERRLNNIRAIVRKHTNKLFFFLDFKTINCDGIFRARWARPSGEERQSLI
jgi:hypothetical protein